MTDQATSTPNATLLDRVIRDAGPPPAHWQWYDAVLVLRAANYWCSYHVLREAMGHDVTDHEFTRDDILRVMARLDRWRKFLPTGRDHLNKMDHEDLIQLCEKRPFLFANTLAARELPAREVLEMIPDEPDEDLRHMRVVELADKIMLLEMEEGESDD